MMMLADELKPCPYCGKEMQRRDQDDAGEHMVWCENCGAYGPNDTTRKRADEMWNMRRPEDALRAELKKERELSTKLYLLLVDNPDTKLLADKILIDHDKD